MSRLAGGDLASTPRSAAAASMLRSPAHSNDQAAWSRTTSRPAPRRRDARRAADEAVRRETKPNARPRARTGANRQRAGGSVRTPVRRQPDFRISAEFPPLSEGERRLQRRHRPDAARRRRHFDSVRGIASTPRLSRTHPATCRAAPRAGATLEETASALGEITQTVKKAADSALHAREVVVAATATPEGRGRRQAGGRRDGRHRQIGAADHPHHRRDRRDRLSDQPLALNAGVEARARRAGRGFAVVASECVRWRNARPRRPRRSRGSSRLDRPGRPRRRMSPRPARRSSASWPRSPKSRGHRRDCGRRARTVDRSRRGQRRARPHGSVTQQNAAMVSNRPPPALAVARDDGAVAARRPVRDRRRRRRLRDTAETEARRRPRRPTTRSAAPCARPRRTPSPRRRAGRRPGSPPRAIAGIQL